MACALCLKVPRKLASLIDIYKQKKSELNIDEVIKKYMWIEPDDENNKFICTLCWKSLLAFHRFYTQIQKAHREFEEVVIKEGVMKDVSINKDFTEICVDEEKTDYFLDKGENAKEETYEEEQIKIEADPDFCVNNFNERLSDEKVLDESVMENNILDLLTVKNEDPIDAAITPAEDVVEEKTKVRRCKLKRTKNGTKAKKQIAVTNKEKIENNNSMSTEASDQFIAQHYKLICCLCDTQIPTFAKLKRHFRAVHNQHGYVICCKKKLLRRCLLIDHINYHRDPNYFKCTYCEKVFCSRSSLDSHVKVQHESDEPLHDCQYCLKRFFNRTILNQHVLTHVPENEKTVPCPKCEKCFVNKYTMNKHLRLVHLNTYAKVCHRCGKLIRGGPSWVKWHIEEHAGVEHAFTQCDICFAKVRGKYGMKRHMRLYHTVENQTPQVCAICGKESATLSSHKSHMKYVHTMERKHACSLCDKVFKRPLALKEHMTTHTGERLYTCPHCPKTFNSSANMHSHRKKAHPKEFEERRREKQREMFIEKPTEKKEL